MTHSNIVLIGPPGSGKTLCGYVLSQQLRWQFLDTDQVIEQDTGADVAQIFAEKGEGCFRQLERNCLERLVKNVNDASFPRTVIGTGGGLPIMPGNFEMLLNLGEIVSLSASLDELVARLERGKPRPLFVVKASDRQANEQTTESRLEALLRQRAAIYKKPRHQIDTTRLSPEQVAAKIIDLLKL